MKKKLTLLLGMLALVILIAGAYVFYEKYADSYAPDGLVQDSPSTDPTQNTEVPPESDGPSESETETEAETPNLTPAPEFTVTDEEGSAVRFSDKIGKPIVLNFWASWCPPCKNEMPDFESAYAAYGDRVEFMMINMTDGNRETVDIAKAYIEKMGYTFPVYYDTAYEVAIAYSVYSLPTTYFIDAEGNLIAHITGMLNEDVLQRGLEMIAPDLFQQD